ncbi:hypothetical protein FRB94_006901 [Tulasnella sp. JGI-2019a]|nr:hypothetical protein FRB94_006901 [Tulasnella sp. JGI-2019a]KAG9029981.1 hypothetical protein FRB95_004684 [Tulasnella sp. JGI-2019a]
MDLATRIAVPWERALPPSSSSARTDCRIAFAKATEAKDSEDRDYQLHQILIVFSLNNHPNPNSTATAFLRVSADQHPNAVSLIALTYLQDKKVVGTAGALSQAVEARGQLCSYHPAIEGPSKHGHIALNGDHVYHFARWDPR